MLNDSTDNDHDDDSLTWLYNIIRWILSFSLIWILDSFLNGTSAATSSIWSMKINSGLLFRDSGKSSSLKVNVQLVCSSSNDSRFTYLDIIWHISFAILMRTSFHASLCSPEVCNRFPSRHRRISPASLPCSSSRDDPPLDWLTRILFRLFLVAIWCEQREIVINQTFVRRRRSTQITFQKWSMKNLDKSLDPDQWFSLLLYRLRRSFQCHKHRQRWLLPLAGWKVARSSADRLASNRLRGKMDAAWPTKSEERFKRKRFEQWDRRFTSSAPWPQQPNLLSTSRWRSPSRRPFTSALRNKAQSVPFSTLIELDANLYESGSSTFMVSVIRSISCLSFVLCCRNGLWPFSSL